MPVSSFVAVNRAVCLLADVRTPEVSTPCAVSQDAYSAKSWPTEPTSSGLRPRQPRPYEMFPATPPRLISRSPTRNDTEILSSFSAISVSVNLPANIIRWSVAIDPVTAIRIVGGLYSAFGA